MCKNFIFKLCAIALVFSFVSIKEAKGQQSDTTQTFILKEITVSSGVKNKALSPLRLVDIDEKEILVSSTGRTYPELLRDVPGIYATAETGSYGDAKINIRGFKQENISVLLNGIPISGLTTGSMFWNNWLGLTDATATIQVQKGVGGSMLSDNSVGGSINIITKTASGRSNVNGGITYGGGGVFKTYLGYNSGELKNGWGVSLMASKTWGHTWVECTDVSSISYMLSVSKRINARHSLLFTALGSPEKHNQRSSRLSVADVEKYGIGYNKNWGYITLTDKNGKSYQEARTLNKNNYHKPYFILNHFYNNGGKVSLNNAMYLAIGHGGGYWAETKGKKIASYLKDGYVDWDSVVADNKVAAAAGKSATNIMSDYIAGHTQFGLKSALDLKLSNKLTFGTGIHYQYYATWEHEKITDLLGGDFWYEDYASKSLMGEAGRDPYKEVGDFIRTHNGKTTHFGTLYATLGYTSAKWNVELGTSLNVSSTKRWDKYNYAIGQHISEAANGVGASVKAGALYRLSNKGKTSQSLYMNAAYYSRVPYSNVFFASGNNQISKGVKNEQNYLAELGYRLLFAKGGIEATFYASYWKNKSIMSNPYKPLDDDSYKFMITGLDAFHYGLEIDAHYNFTKWLNIGAWGSFGSWKWKNDVSANIYDPYSGQIAQTVEVYSNGLPVGDAPQTQIGAKADFNIAKGLNAGIIWTFNDRYWADFEPNTRTNANDKTEPYRIPSYNLVNLSANYHLPINVTQERPLALDIFINVNNLFDEMYIERGKDGADHTLDTFTGYWGQGINFNCGLKISF